MSMPALMSDGHTTDLAPDEWDLPPCPASRAACEGWRRLLPTFMGKVNADEFIGYAPGTVMLVSANIHPGPGRTFWFSRKHIQSDLPPRVVLHFRAREIPWNSLAQFGMPGESRDADGRPIREAIDFAPLVENQD